MSCMGVIILGVITSRFSRRLRPIQAVSVSNLGQNLYGSVILR